MTDDGFIEIRRDCDAVQIPYGTSTMLQEGAEVAIAQKLGDTFTVRTRQGFLLRVDGCDADALGLDRPEQVATEKSGGPFDEARVWEALKSCYDPEIPINIVDLGLIYGCESTPLNNGDYRITVQMTLTAPGCGMGQVLKDDIERKVSALPGVKEAEVELLFDPPWDPSRMTEAARLHLGLF